MDPDYRMNQLQSHQQQQQQQQKPQNAPGFTFPRLNVSKLNTESNQQPRKFKPFVQSHNLTENRTSLGLSPTQTTRSIRPPQLQGAGAERAAGQQLQSIFHLSASRPRQLPNPAHTSLFPSLNRAQNQGSDDSHLDNTGKHDSQPRLDQHDKEQLPSSDDAPSSDQEHRAPPREHDQIEGATFLSSVGRVGSAMSTDTQLPEPRMTTPRREQLPLQEQGNSIDSVCAALARSLHQSHDAESAARKLEIEKLHSQITQITSERDSLSKRLEDVKSGAKEALSRSSESLGVLQESFKTLKVEYNQSINTLHQECHAEISALGAMKESVLDKLSDIQELMDDNGRLIIGTESKHIIAELQLECNNSHQANEYLRHRLASLSQDLRQAQEHVFELKKESSEEQEAHKANVESCLASASKIEKLTSRLEKREEEHLEAFQRVVGLEEERKVLEACIADLRANVESKEEEIASLSVLQLRNQELEALLKEAKTTIDVLKDVQHKAETKASEANGTLEARSARIASLEAQLGSMERVRDMLTSDLSEQRAQHRLTLEEMATTSAAQAEKLHSAAANFASAQSDIRSLTEKLDASTAENEALKKEIAVVKSDLSQKESEYLMLDKKFNVLTERFEDQTISLRLVKEQHGDIQERLVSMTAEHTASLKDANAKLNFEVERLEKEKEELQLRIKKTFEHDKELLINNLDHEKKTLVNEFGVEKNKLLAEKDDMSSKLAIAQEEHVQLVRTSKANHDELERQIASLNSIKTGLELKLSALQNEKSHLQELLDKRGQEHSENLRRATEDYEKRLVTLEAKQADSLKEQLAACERSSRTAVEAHYKVELSSLKSDFVLLNSSLESAQAESSRHSTALKDMQEQYENRLAERQALLDEKSARLDEIQQRTTELTQRNSELQERHTVLEEANAQLLLEIKSKQSPGKQGSAILDTMKAQLEKVKLEHAALLEKKNTLSQRYEKGQLDESERRLITTVILRTKEASEDDVVKKTNELVRRDKQIAALEAEVGSLRNSLIQHMKTNKKKEAPQEPLLKFKHWTKSSPAPQDESAINELEEPKRPATPPLAPALAIPADTPSLITDGDVTMVASEKRAGGVFSRLGEDESDPLTELDETLLSPDRTVTHTTKRKRVSGQTADHRAARRHRPSSPPPGTTAHAAESVISKMKPNKQSAKDIALEQPEAVTAPIPKKSGKKTGGRKKAA